MLHRPDPPRLTSHGQAAGPRIPCAHGRLGRRATRGSTSGALLLGALLALGLASCQDLLNPLAVPEEAAYAGLPEFDPMRNQSVTITPRESVISALDATTQLSATVRNGAGKVVQNPNITWRSLNQEVARVNSAGRVTALSVGMALITATSNGAVDTASVEVRQVVARVIVSPGSRVLDVGTTLQLSAAAEDSSENRMVREFAWRSARPEVAEVDQNGLVTALDTGVVAIQALALPDSVGGTSIITVLLPPPPPPPPGPPLPPGEWHRELSDTTITGDVVVPPGERWLIGAGVRIAGNLRTDAGTIAMRPGSSLRFLGANPEEYVGGGHYFEPHFARDIGLWVGGHGTLDISCTPKTSWNRTGSDPTWAPGDEYWIAPTAPGDFAPRRWYPGQAVPRMDPRMPAAEIANVTRDCVIEGPGHIHIHSHHPQRIEYVQLRGLGISRESSNGPVLGRYALHLHHGGHGTHGTVIRGVAAIGSLGRVFVPHESHGITMTDNVSVNSFAEGLWWDIGDRTDDTTVDRLLVMGVRMPGAISRSGFSGVVLGGGDRNTITRSAVAGTHGRRHSHGFDWPAKVDDHGPALWHFGSNWEEANVAHNNEGDGIRLWLKAAPHTTTHFYTYRNGAAGVSTGRYRGNSRFAEALILDDHIDQNASSAVMPDGFGTIYERVRVENSRGPALIFGTQNLPGSGPHGFIDCTLQSAAGHPRVQVSASAKTPVFARFVRCGLTPEDIRFPATIQPELEGSLIIIEHEDGRRWEIGVDVANNQAIVTLLP